MAILYSQNKFPDETQHHRAYDCIRDMVRRQELPPGKRILIEPLADQLFVSNTPVREALIQLSAERIINDIPKAGFFTKQIDENEIRDLYALSQLLLDKALRVTRKSDRTLGMLKPPDLVHDLKTPTGTTVATMHKSVMRLFIHIARQSGNGDLIRLVKNINDRTYFIRLKEFEFSDDLHNNLLHLCQLYLEREIDQLRQALYKFHQERIDQLPQVLRLLRGSSQG